MSRTADLVIQAVITVATAAGQSPTSAPASAAAPAAAASSAVSLSGVTAPPHPSWLTDTVVFDFLFKHVTLTESHADDLVAIGKNDSSERHLFKNAAKLTGQEEALLKSTAQNAQSTLTTFAANSAKTVKGLMAQYPTKASLPPSAVQQLQGLDTRRKQILQSNMAALQAGMSPARFQQFYNFAWGTEGPRIRPAQPGSKPRAGVKAPPAPPKP